MSPTHLAQRACRLAAVLVLAAAACSRDTRRSPVCGMSLLVGPNLIQQQLSNPRALLTEVPLGLPATLPARIAGQADTGRAVVGAAQGQLNLHYEGSYFPTGVTDSTVYGLLVVDDSTARVVGLLVYEGIAPPSMFPRIGTVSGGAARVPLFGVRLNWADVSNPRCPLLGSPSPG